MVASPLRYEHKVVAAFAVLIQVLAGRVGQAARLLEDGTLEDELEHVLGEEFTGKWCDR